MSEIKVAVIHRKLLHCEGIASILRSAGFEVCASVPDVPALLRAVDSEPGAVVVILANAANGGSVADAVARIKEGRSEARVLIVAEHLTDGEELAAAHAAGASGFLTTDAPPDALIEYVRLVSLGMQAFPLPLGPGKRAGSLPGRGLKTDRRHEFSERELEILKNLAAGSSNKVIARKLLITESTVKAHVRSILRKLGAKNRTQAAVWAAARPQEGGNRNVTPRDTKNPPLANSWQQAPAVPRC